MKSLIPLAIGLVALGVGFHAAAEDRAQLKLIAQEAGLSVDDVRMVLGDRTSHAQYRTSFDRKEARVKEAIARIVAKRQDDGRTQVAEVAIASY